MNSAMLALLITISFLLVSVPYAVAVPPGKVMSWSPAGGSGKVSVDGAVHAGKGIKCMECHTKIFPMKKGAVRFAMSDVYAGRYCGECHNGTRGFSAKAPENCGRCHKK